MPDAINLGTLFADVKLDISKLAAARQAAGVELKAIGDNLGRIATQAEASGKRVEASIFSDKQKAELQKQKAALQAQKQVFADYATGVTNVLGGAFAGLAAGSAAVVKMSADFNQSMTSIQNNTTMTDRDLQQMKQTVLSLGKESGAGFDDLAQGYMHVANFGNDAAQSTKILRVAMEASVATGAKTADTANILAASLHMFGLSGDDATKAMNVLHLAAAEGNMTLEEFTSASGQAFAFGSQLGLTITDVSAAFSALTRNGFSAAEAGTQVKAMFTHITEPAQKAQEEIEHLRKTTGVDLTQDFTAAGLKARGLAGVLQDIQKATHGDADAIEKLVPAMRGGIGVMSLAGKGGKDLTQILGDLSDGWSGKLDPTTQGYERSLHNLNTEIAKVTNEIKADMIPAGEKLTPVFESAIPVIKETASVVGHVADAFAGLPEPIKEIGLELGTTVIGLKGASSVLDGLGIKLPGLSRIFKNLKTDIGGATTEVEGLTTKLGWLESIGPIAVTVLVSWEVGTKIGNAIADQMQAETDKQLGTAQASKNSKQLTADRDLLAKDPSKLTADESGRLGDLIDATSTRYGVKASGFLGEFTDADRAKMVDFLNREINVQKNLEAHRLYGPAFVQRPAAPKQKPAPKTAPHGNGNSDGGDDDDDGPDDAGDAATAKRQRELAALQRRIDALLEEYKSTGSAAARYELAGPGQLLQQLSKAKQGDADADYNAKKGDEPQAAAEERKTAYANAANDYADLARKIRTIDAERIAYHQRMAEEEAAGNQAAAADQIREHQDMIDNIRKAGDDYVSHQEKQIEAEVKLHQLGAEAAIAEYQQLLTWVDKNSDKAEALLEKIQALNAAIEKSKEIDVTDDEHTGGRDRGDNYDGPTITTKGKDGSVLTQAADIAKETAAADNIRHLWSGVWSDVGKAADQNMEHWKGFHSFMKSMLGDIKKDLLDFVKTMTKNTVMRALLGDRSGVSKDAPSWANIGSLFGGSKAAATSTPPIVGAADAAGAAAPGGGGLGGGLGGLLGIFGKGGMGGIGGALGHALPWVGGGLLLNQMLGNPIGKLFKKFRFAEGGNIPAAGGYVAEGGTRGEWVVPRTPSMALPQRLLDNLGNHAASAAMAAGGNSGVNRGIGALHVHVNMGGGGDGRISTTDARHIGNQVGWHVRQHLATATGEQF